MASIIALVLLTGCSSIVQAPGARGMLLDADTGKPIRGAKITRAAVMGNRILPLQMPKKTATTGCFGRFHIPVEREWGCMFVLYSPPNEFTPTFTIVADGYVTTNVTTTVSSNTHWSADFGRFKLHRQ